MLRFNSHYTLDEKELTHSDKVFLATRIECESQIEQVKSRLRNVELSGYDMERLKDATQTIRELAERSGVEIGPLIEEVKKSFDPSNTQELKARLTQQYNQLEKFRKAVGRTSDKPWMKDNVVEVTFTDDITPVVPPERICDVVKEVATNLNKSVGKDVMDVSFSGNVNDFVAIVHCNSSYQDEMRSALTQMSVALKKERQDISQKKWPDVSQRELGEIRATSFRSNNVVHEVADMHQLEIAKSSPLVIPQESAAKERFQAWRESAFGGMLEGVRCGKDQRGCQEAATLSIARMVEEDPSISLDVTMNMQKFLSQDAPQHEVERAGVAMRR